MMPWAPHFYETVNHYETNRHCEGIADRPSSHRGTDPRVELRHLSNAITAAAGRQPKCLCLCAGQHPCITTDTKRQDMTHEKR